MTVTLEPQLKIKPNTAKSNYINKTKQNRIKSNYMPQI